MLLLRVIVSELWPIVTRVTPRNHIISCPRPGTARLQLTSLLDARGESVMAAAVW